MSCEYLSLLRYGKCFQTSSPLHMVRGFKQLSTGLSVPPGNLGKPRKSWQQRKEPAWQMLCRKPANKNASLRSNALWSANQTSKTFWLVSKTLLQFDFLTILPSCAGSWIPRHLVGEGPQMSIQGCPFLSSALMYFTFSPIFHLSICLFMLSATSAESLRDDKTFLFYPEGLH